MTVNVTTTLEVKHVTTNMVHDAAVTVVLPVSELERQCGKAVSELERQCGYYKTKCQYYKTKCQALEQSVRHTATTFQRKHAERELRCTVSLRRMRNQMEVLEQARVRYLANTQTTITALEAQIQQLEHQNQLLVLQQPPPPLPPPPPQQHDNGTTNKINKSIVDVNDLERERVTDMDDQREEEEEKEEKRNHFASRTNYSIRKYSSHRNTKSRMTTITTSASRDDNANCREGMMLVVPFSRSPVAGATAAAAAAAAANHHHTYPNRSSHSRNMHRTYSSSSSSSRPPFLVAVHEEEEEKEEEDTCSDSSSSSSSSSSWQFNLISSSLSSSYGIF